MLKLNCTSCGAEVIFRSQASVFAVCSYCKATLVRTDKDLKAIGKMADLQYDVTPLQVGTKGMFGEVGFEIIGRLRVGYSDGFWNEWHTLFSKGETGWLAEAQGFYAVCFSVEELPAVLPAVGDLKPGLLVNLEPNSAFEVEDFRQVNCLYSEGELPMNAPQGRKSVSVDLTSSGGRMATIEYADDQTRVFVGGYQDFDDFAFQNLRRIDGWSQPQAK